VPRLRAWQLLCLTFPGSPSRDYGYADKQAKKWWAITRWLQPRCGRLNEGGEGTVQGVARSSSAVLVVTSGRNGQVVRGHAIREGSSLRWQVLEELEAGEPEGDSGLILHRGILRKVRQ
jgi:hypothetical protein